ncbi:EAL domain-containing protein [Salmonella enterica]|uniref:EAL domain-containing protein n=1 Tax=Salmonella enterica TaxID=28901 RepID=UPI00071D3FA2|nr:EAL domain-containing protein [Salmonella enterica]EBM9478519.1 EAL domain-containing protein [Salmonella enterica subsp. enterica serovar Rubislaw]ECT6468335.1 EAL domain-containing protein [Salmonella enterica subsp. enterica serovar Senegal]EHC8528263.1 EAL domain-containing protein [Salmonella enterica subsp. enterica serovar 11:r:-]EAQ5803189.1 EAL domain-containing protein [Salmonella enterica]EBO3245432.1 EAL domain-containing protein [Salmonella enterica subsp. enterica serovar Rubi
MNFFINISIPLLFDIGWLKKILSIVPGPKVLEVDLNQNESYFPVLVQHLNSTLKTILNYFNAEIWLDDINERQIQLLSTTSFRFDGIKIDKYEFWKIYAEHDQYKLNSFILNIKKNARIVLIEGIENVNHLNFVYNSDTDYGQGFLWPVDERSSFAIEL